MMRRFESSYRLRVALCLMALPALARAAQNVPAPAAPPLVSPAGSGSAATPSPAPQNASGTLPGSMPAAAPGAGPFPTAPTSLVLDASRPLALHAGDGVTTFTLTNRAATAQTVTLTPGPILDADSHTAISRARAIFSLPSAAALAGTSTSTTGASTPAGNLTLSLAPNQTVTLQASVTGVTGSSAAEVPIYSGPMPLGSLRLFVQDAPLNLSIDGDGTTNSPLAYSFSEPVSVVLKNGDAQPYSLHWEFQIDNQALSSGDAQVPANGTVRLLIKPGACSDWGNTPGLCGVYGALDRMHPSTRQGLLVISLAGADGIARGLLPSRSVPVNLRMQRIAPAVSTAISYVYAGVLLFLGGLLSVIAGSVLPNMQAKADLRAQLKDLANRTTSLSTRIDSYLRVLLRLERKRLELAIYDATVWLPTATEPLTPITDAMATLSRRLAASEVLDDLRRKHDAISETAPPSVTDCIDNTLQAAADQLYSLTLSDTEYAAAKSLLAKAKDWLDMLDNPEELAKLIAGNLVSLQTRMAKFPVDYAQDLRTALPGIWVVLDRGFDDPKNIVRPMLFAIDHAIAAIHLALDYALVRASIPLDPASDPARLAAQAQAGNGGAGAPGVQPLAEGLAGPRDAPVAGGPLPPQSTTVSTSVPLIAPLHATAPKAGPVSAADPRSVVPPNAPGPPRPFGQLARSQRDRVLRHEPQFLELLGTLSWRALREANQLVAQMREDIYEEDVLSEAAKPGQTEITFDTQVPRPFLPVFFAVTFKDRRYNGTAALGRLLCHWEFPDTLEEEGWKVCHYFSGDEKPYAGDDGSAGLRGGSEGKPGADGRGQAGDGKQLGVPGAAPASQAASLSATSFPPGRDQPPAQGHRGLRARLRRQVLPPVTIQIQAQIRGQRDWEAREVPIPALKKTIPIQRTRHREPARYVPELLRFVIAFGVALAGLLSGALGQLEKLDFIPATIAVLALGFGADSIKNLLTQAPRKPGPAGT